MANTIKLTRPGMDDAYYDNTYDALTAATKTAGSEVNFTTTVYVEAAATSNEVNFNTTGTYTLTGGNGALLNYEVQLNSGKAATDVEATVNITGAHLTAGKINLYNNSTMSIKDSTVDFMNFQSGSSWFGVKKNSVLTIDNSTASSLDWREVETWNLDSESIVALGAGKNDFTGDALNVDLTDWNEVTTDLLTTTDEKLFDTFDAFDADSVKLGTEVASWNGDKNAWCSTTYALQLSDDKTKVSLMLASKLA